MTASTVDFKQIARDILTQCRAELGIQDDFEPIHYRLAMNVWYRFAYGIPHEMWLYAHRDSIKGLVLDVASHRFLHEWIYRLPGVQDSKICALEPEMVYDLERFNAGTYRTHVDYVQDLTAAQMDIPDQSFDTVICTNVLEHCVDPFKMMGNLYRLLRPGGTLLLAVPHLAAEHGPIDLWRFTNMGLEYLAQQAGFDPKQVMTESVLHFDEEWFTRFGEYPLPRVFVDGGERKTRRVGIPYLNCVKGTR